MSIGPGMTVHLDDEGPRMSINPIGGKIYLNPGKKSEFWCKQVNTEYCARMSEKQAQDVLKLLKIHFEEEEPKSPLNKFTPRQWDEFINKVAYNESYGMHSCLVCKAFNGDCNVCGDACAAYLSIPERIDRLIARLEREGIFDPDEIKPIFLLSKIITLDDGTLWKPEPKPEWWGKPIVPVLSFFKFKRAEKPYTVGEFYWIPEAEGLLKYAIDLARSEGLHVDRNFLDGSFGGRKELPLKYKHWVLNCKAADRIIELLAAVGVIVEQLD